MSRSIQVTVLLLFFATYAMAQSNSMARIWMDALLEAVKKEEGRPTIHSRNMFHTSVALYDAWAAYDTHASPYLLGNQLGEFSCAFQQDFPIIGPVDSLRDIAMNYAAYRLIHFRLNPFSSKGRTIEAIDSTFKAHGGDIGFNSADYLTGDPAALGNYIADCLIQYGLQDGANEEELYDHIYYEPINPALKPQLPGNPNLKDPNRWQPISLREYVEQRGLDPDLNSWNIFTVITQEIFLSPEWGQVQPFAMQKTDQTWYEEEGYAPPVYLDPGRPPQLDYARDSLQSEWYKWGFLLVASWSAQLDPADSVYWDISPASRGNSIPLPETFKDFPNYYDIQHGGTKAFGRAKNPYTNAPYEPNKVLRGDYARVIAEFWVDGVNTVTPPGHWFNTLNYVSDHPRFEHRWMGKGKKLDRLEWDVKTYLCMGGAMHDAAIAAWSVKGYYDYIRPISAIRYMAEKGQCTQADLPNYHPAGLPLLEGFIEIVQKGDALAGPAQAHLGKLKIKSWRGPEYIQDPGKDQAGVGWILAENWWPYQRYSLTTPPFAGYVSGHSTFSLAAAKVLTLLTGDEYFPDGLAEFQAKKNAFLLFEEGPSQDIRLQWATYEDAAHETCLSRIWGGIHPPADDIPGRKMGRIIGEKAVAKANQYFK